jgi:hypothetical protein
MMTTKSANDPHRSGGGDKVAVEAIDTHVFFVEGVVEIIEMHWKAIRSEFDHEGNPVNRIIFINPNAFDRRWKWRKVQPWAWKYINAVMEHVSDNVMR